MCAVVHVLMCFCLCDKDKTKGKLGKKEFTSLIAKPSRNLEAGTKTETMGELCLLACLP